MTLYSTSVTSMAVDLPRFVYVNVHILYSHKKNKWKIWKVEAILKH